jgi:nucleotide-binding universal stress UspA family protein
VLAKAHGASLQLLHVLDPSSIRSVLRGPQAPELEEQVRVEAKRALDSLADDVNKATGVVVAQVLREGAVMDEMLAAAKQNDLLVLGPRGLNPVRDFFLGATAERMARMIPSAMLVAKQDHQIRYDHVLVPVDFSKYSAPALRFAAEFAPGATLHVFHAVDLSLHGRLRVAGVSDDALTTYREQLLGEAHASLSELIAGLTNRAVGVAAPGDARVLIDRRAAERGCTLIVMGKQGRSWIAEHLIGSVTRHVLERAACDVVVVPQS